MLPVKNSDDIPFLLYGKRESLAAKYCPIREESGSGNLLIPSLMSGASTCHFDGSRLSHLFPGGTGILSVISGADFLLGYCNDGQNALPPRRHYSTPHDEGPIKANKKAFAITVSGRFLSHRISGMTMFGQAPFKEFSLALIS
jgi:hypothetical protein